MARTPLLHAFQQLSRDVAEARARRLPVEAVQEERQTRISRRTLLKGLGALAGGVALGGSLGPAYASASSVPRIGIVGAGIAGLNKAVTSKR